MDRWVNKVALVTGVTSGIGRAIAEILVENGLKVIGLDRQVDKIKILSDELKSKTGKLIPLQCDLSNEMEIVRTIDWIEKNVGVVEILVNNAAIDLPSLLCDGGVDEWRKSLDVNILGVVILIKGMLRLLKKKGLNSGVIININDVGAWNNVNNINNVNCNQPITTGYLTTKNALRSLTENLRLELAQIQSNIKVISIVPGLVETMMSEQTLRENIRLSLKTKDVADLVLLSIQTPETVLIQDLVITPIREVVVA